MSELQTSKPMQHTSPVSALHRSYEHAENLQDGALQELIDILSKPYTQTCLQCQGWGIGVRNQICPTCGGKGSLLRG